MSPPRDPLDPTRLLDHAARLANGTGDRGRPYDIDLRRSASASYYALFHQITDLTTEKVFGASPAALQYGVRWLRHADVAQACRLVTTFSSLATRDPRWKPERAAIWEMVRHTPPDATLTASCVAFLDLQSLRHVADYDRSTRIDRPAARQAHADATSAVDAMRSLRGHNDPGLSTFLGLVAFSAGRLPAS